MKKRVTLKDIARRAGVTVATVSMALRAHPSISAARTAEIRRIADDLGYAPDPALGALAAYRDRKAAPRDITFAYLQPEEDANASTSKPNKETIRNSARAHAEKLGYRFEDFQYSNHPKAQARLARVMINRGIRHLLVGPRRYTLHRQPLNFPWEHFCTISILNPHSKGRLHCCIPDFFSNIRVLLWEVCRRSFNSIGLFIEKAYLEWSNETALCMRPSLFPSLKSTVKEVPPCVNSSGSQQALLDWYERFQPEVILTNGSHVPGILRDAGIAVPGQCSVASVDNRQMQDCSGIDIQPTFIARNAVDLLHAKALSFEFGLPDPPMRLTQIGSWNEGGTLRER